MTLLYRCEELQAEIAVLKEQLDKTRKQSANHLINVYKNENECNMLKEQVAQLEKYESMFNAINTDFGNLEETIAQQAEDIATLKEQVDLQIPKGILQQQQETIAQQVEALRLASELMQEVEGKYFALLKEKDEEAEHFEAEGDMYGWNFYTGMRSGAVELHIYMTKLIKALAIQPNHDILRERDARLVEKFFWAMGGQGVTKLMEIQALIRNGEWK